MIDFFLWVVTVVLAYKDDQLFPSHCIVQVSMPIFIWCELLFVFPFWVMVIFLFNRTIELLQIEQLNCFKLEN